MHYEIEYSCISHIGNVRKMNQDKLVEVLKRNGVRKNMPAVITAIKDAKEGIVTRESACDTINSYLENTEVEAIVYENTIIFLEYEIDPVTLSDDIVCALESDGFTVIQTEEFYEFY